MGSAKRTPSGAPTAAARDKYGDEKGAFPIMDRKSATSAINLRHNSNQETSAQVLRRAAAWAKANNDPVIAGKVATARAKDAKK